MKSNDNDNSSIRVEDEEHLKELTLFLLDKLSGKLEGSSESISIHIIDAQRKVGNDKVQ